MMPKTEPEVSKLGIEEVRAGVLPEAKKNLSGSPPVREAVARSAKRR